MRSFQRDTAAAFGDTPERDVEAEFGAVSGKLAAKAPAKSSVSVSVKAPKLAVVAPPKPATKPAPTVKVAVPTASAKAKVVTTAKPTSSVPRSTVATTAQQGNFLDAGSAPIASGVKAPAGTVAMTQAQRDANARALLKQKTLANAARNAPYRAEVALERKRQQVEHARLMADPGPDGQRYRAQLKFISSAGLDTGQITMGAKVIAIGAAVIASGGAAAGAVGVTTGGAALASAAAADRLVAAVEKGGELGKKAKGVISDVKAAAAKGDAVAKQALGSIEAVAKERLAAAVPKGVEQTLTAAAADAANAVAGAALGLSGSGALNVSAALSAAAGKSSSSGYAPALTSARRAAVSSRAPAKQLSQFDSGPSEPRWLVTPEARVIDLNRSPGKADDRGYLVTTAGKVVRQ